MVHCLSQAICIYLFSLEASTAKLNYYEGYTFLITAYQKIFLNLFKICVLCPDGSF